jgi:hypothetical protein
VSAAPRLVTGGLLATVTARQLAEEDLGEIDWLIPSFVGRGLFTIVYGAPKSGKTTLCAHMAAAMIRSRLFLGEDISISRPVLWLDLEQSRRVMRLKVLEIDAHRAPSEEMHIYSGRSPALSELLDTIDHLGVVAVFVDSLSRWCLLGEENSSSEVTAAIARFLPEFQEREVALVAVHHARKSDGESGQNMRGSVAWLAACDVAIECKKEKEAEEYGSLRRLTLVSRLEGERATSVRLTADGFVEELPPARRQEARILEQLALGPQTITTLKEVLGLSQEALRTRLEALRGAGRVTRGGGRPQGRSIQFRGFSRSPRCSQIAQWRTSHRILPFPP